MSGELAAIYGVQELVGKLKHPHWAEIPMGRLMDRWRFDVERGAKANIKRGDGGWLWKGGDRQSLTSERDDSPMPLWAKAGSNSKTVRFGEYGTGLLSEDPESKHRRYMPPAAALEPWAREHGTTGAEVALSIFKAGGLKPRRFLRNAASESAKRIPEWAEKFAREVETAAAHAE